jgi:DNA-directed RNA polymerase subunit F
MYQNFESIIKENLFYIVVSPGVKEKIRARLESENENISDENIKSIAFYLHKYYR